MKSRGFECVARADARVLILGTLPGKVSLERGEYYAQPRNTFWRIMGDLAGASPALPYGDRLRLLKENGIALWDVCAAGHRSGSLDSAIRLSTVETNDIGEFLRVHPGIGLICFNGKKAKEIYDRKVVQKPPAPFARIRYEVVPSTSPAHAAMSYHQKLSRWRIVLGSGSGSRWLRSNAAPSPFEEVETYPCPSGGSS
ncbi:MAG: DNA-deoxyinosine glycosylase [Terriglobia bacterium]|jgi:hypoxanthine-DNA glycosylase